MGAAVTRHIDSLTEADLDDLFGPVLVCSPADDLGCDVDAAKAERERRRLEVIARGGLHDYGHGWDRFFAENPHPRGAWVNGVYNAARWFGLENADRIAETIGGFPCDGLVLDDLPFIVDALLDVEQAWAARFGPRQVVSLPSTPKPVAHVEPEPERVEAWRRCNSTRNRFVMIGWHVRGADDVYRFVSAAVPPRPLIRGPVRIKLDTREPDWIPASQDRRW
jgi:hypothetical protein